MLVVLVLALALGCGCGGKTQVTKGTPPPQVGGQQPKAPPR
jgi:hypothetical protein